MSIEGRYVCDTNLLISSLLNSHTPPAQTLDWIIDQGVLLFSRSTHDELQAILQRAKFDRYLAKDKRLDFLHSLKAIIEWVEIRENIAACRDPRDNQFLEVAVNGKANFIITGDQDLLVLETIHGIPIVTPRFFIEQR